MPNEKLQMRLVKLALREIGSAGFSKDVTNWISTNYKRNRVGLKKTRYLLTHSDDVDYTKKDNDYYFWFKEPKKTVKEILLAGIKKTGSRKNLAIELNSSSSQIQEWLKGTMHPSEKSLHILDEYFERLI